MASVPNEPRPVFGRLDRKGRLIAADPELEALQREAGSSLGQELALPQVGAVAQLARKLGTSVSRPAIAASADSDIELWVNATPEGDEVLLSLEGWKVRPAAVPRLGNLLGDVAAGADSTAQHEWTADEELRVISLSTDLAELLGVDVAEAAGQPLTRLVRLEEDESGDLPLVSAIAARRGFSAQPARSRDGKRSFRISGEVVTGADGAFAGFRGTVRADESKPGARSEAFDHALDEVLRSPLDRIIETAERIVERADGPLRSDYASYGSDIAAAAKHLLSVLRGMTEEAIADRKMIDLTALAAEAVVMVESAAEERKVTIDLDAGEALRATGQEPAVIQILVNLVGNAIRHSPEGSTVKLVFARTSETAAVTVSDQGPGIASADQQRIFERFEQAHGKEDGTGLGLAISRRLARSMGGDVTVESAPGQGAHFTLTLPAA